MPDDHQKSAALAEALKQAKTAKMHFALVLKGATDGELIVAKTKIPPTEIGEAKKRSGGSKVVEGMCQSEDGSLVFETQEDPSPQWDNAVKLIAKRDAGATIRPQFRQAPTASGGAAPQPNAAPANQGAPGAQRAPAAQQQPPAASPQAPSDMPPQGHANQNDWQLALHGIEPRLLQVLKENRGDTAKMKSVFALARQKADAGAYDVALQALHSLEQLLGRAASAPAAPQATAAAPGGQPPAPPKGPPPPGPKPNAPTAPETDYSRWRERAQALDGYINQFTGYLNELKDARGAYADEYERLGKWSEKSYQELKVVLDLMSTRMEGKDESQLDPATQQSVDLLYSLSNAALNPDEFAKCSARFEPPRTSSKEVFEERLNDRDRLAILKMKQRELREIADGSAAQLKAARQQFDELCRQKNLTAEVDALTAAAQTALESLDRANAEHRAASLKWDEAKQAWDTAGRTANEAAALVKKLAAENAPQNQQAAARQEAESAAQSLAQARAASDQAGAVFSEKTQQLYQAHDAAAQAAEAVEEAKMELRGRVGRFLVTAEQTAETTEFEARQVEDEIARLQLKRALDESQPFPQDSPITMDDRAKMQAFFAKLKLAEPIRGELRKCAVRIDAVRSQVKGTKVAGLGLTEGVAVQYYTKNFGQYCDKLCLYTTEQWDLRGFEQEASFDPSDLSALRQARSAMNSEPGAPLNR